jgi:hypothetical protein
MVLPLEGMILDLKTVIQWLENMTLMHDKPPLQNPNSLLCSSYLSVTSCHPSERFYALAARHLCTGIRVLCDLMDTLVNTLANALVNALVNILVRTSCECSSECFVNALVNALLSEYSCERSYACSCACSCEY